MIAITWVTDLEVENIYPLENDARTFYDGMEAAGREKYCQPASLCMGRKSEIRSSCMVRRHCLELFNSMRNQLAAGLNMGLAGIPWWTTDIGGFHGGNPDDPAFRELFARWFQWGAFCPVMRLHGDREPRQPQYGTTGGATCRSGAANEVWKRWRRGLSYLHKIYADP